MEAIPQETRASATRSSARAIDRTPTLELTSIAPGNIGATWDVIGPWVERACSSNPRVTAEDLRALAEKDEVQVWVGWDRVEERIYVVGVTEILQYPQRKTFVLAYVAGEEPKRWLGFVRTFEEAARQLGCDEIELHHRLSPEYRLHHRVFVKELRNGQ